MTSWRFPDFYHCVVLTLMVVPSGVEYVSSWVQPAKQGL